MRIQLLRLILAIGLGIAAIAATGPSSAQTYPSKPIRFIVPFPAGGSTDAVARAMQPALEKLLGQPVVVENRSGAGGVLGVDAVAKAAPDGYTIGIAGAGALGVNIGEPIKRPYDPAKDLALISKAAGSPFIVVATPTLNARSLDDVIKLAKAEPGRLSIGHGGNGTAMQLAAHDVRHHGRRKDQSGAVSRHGAGGRRHDCRPRPTGHHRSAAVDGCDQRRQAQGARRHVEGTFPGLSRRPDRSTSRA